MSGSLPDDEDTWSTDLGALVHGLEETIQSDLIAHMLALDPASVSPAQLAGAIDIFDRLEGGIEDLLLAPQDGIDVADGLVAMPVPGALSLSIDEAARADAASANSPSAPEAVFTDALAPHVSGPTHALGILFVLDDGSNSQSGLG